MRKFIFMSLVVLSVYAILGVAGFFLWFAFPVGTINGLTYLGKNDLILYYIIINFNDIAGVMLFSHYLYFRFVKTRTPVKDGIIMGIYLVVFSWLLDLFIYVFIRKTLPGLDEYFLGKNQPEIGIAWIVAFVSAWCAGWLHKDKAPFSFKRAANAVFWLTVVSALITAAAINWLDITP